MKKWHKFFDGKYKKARNGCIEWNKSKTESGYGRTTYRKKKWAAHRLSIYLVSGKIPADMVVCHKCDNPSCINPKHLWIGSQGENMIDMMRKNRGSISLLSDIQRKEIKESSDSIEMLMEKYDAKWHVINFIRNIS